MQALRLLRRHPRYLAFGFLHFFSSAVGQTYFVGLFVAGVTAHMGWAEGTFATLYSAATLAAAFTLPVVGAQVDRYRVRYVTTAVALTLAAALCTLATTQQLWLFAVALYAARLGGQGVLPLIASTVIGRFFERGRGTALSLTSIGKSIAEVVVPPLGVYVLLAYGYPALWYGAAAWIALVFLPAVWLLVPRHDAFQRADTVVAEAADASAPTVSLTRGQALRDRGLQLILPVYIFTPLVITGVVFTQGLIAEERGYTLAWMALGVSLYGLMRSVLVLVGGALVDHFGTSAVLRLLHLPMLLGIAVFALVEHRFAALAFFALAGTTMGIESVLWPTLWAERYGPRYLGSIKSAVRVFMVVGTAVSPVLFTWGLSLSLKHVLLAALAVGALAVALVWWSLADR